MPPDADRPAPVRVAYTLEQLWHTVPGGTGIAAVKVAEALAADPGVELVGVAGRHCRVPAPPFAPPIPVRQLRVGAPLLYDLWLRARWPQVEDVTGSVDVAHATGLVPCASAAPLVVTVHDLAWRHAPEQFTRRGVSVFERSLRVIRSRADRVLCSSTATLDDCVAAGLPADRLRLVPLGVDARRATAAEVERVRADLGLPTEYLLFVGTLEPRKNLRRLVAAHASLQGVPPLVVGGAAGWGDSGTGAATGDVRFLGFVAEEDKAGLLAGAAALCYPSEREGFGMPVLEAMAQGTPVVTSSGTSTQEVAGGAAVLVDPFDTADIARGISEALARRAELGPAGLGARRCLLVGGDGAGHR